jgi:para-aminobenzoate synthetase component 2
MAAPSILVVDNYDSFVYNLVQYLAELGAATTVRRNDEVEIDDLDVTRFDGVVISPGPGHPRDAGDCVPMFGVCLGHQALAEAFGADVVAAPELVHGRSTLVVHQGLGVFAGAPSPLIAGRYHSLVVDESTLPDDLEVTARSGDLIMGIRHRTMALEGVQFHPESVLTQDGYLLLANWLAVCGFNDAMGRVETLAKRIDDVRLALPTPR